MTYPAWLRVVRELLGRDGLHLADFAGWDWPGLCADGCTPEEAAAEAVHEWTTLSEDDLGFYDYMMHSDADPGL